MITKEQMTAAVQRIVAVAELVKELGKVPNGVLYANVMSHMSIQEYDVIISTLVREKLITKKNNMLTWIGPCKRN